MDLSLSTRTVGDRTIVEVGGEIDVYTAPKLREQLVELVNDGSYHLVVDMEESTSSTRPAWVCSSVGSSGYVRTKDRCVWCATRSGF